MSKWSWRGPAAGQCELIPADTRQLWEIGPHDSGLEGGPGLQSSGSPSPEPGKCHAQTCQGPPGKLSTSSVPAACHHKWTSSPLALADVSGRGGGVSKVAEVLRLPLEATEQLPVERGACRGCAVAALVQLRPPQCVHGAAQPHHWPSRQAFLFHLSLTSFGHSEVQKSFTCNFFLHSSSHL